MVYRFNGSTLINDDDAGINKLHVNHVNECSIIDKIMPKLMVKRKIFTQNMAAIKLY